MAHNRQFAVGGCAYLVYLLSAVRGKKDCKSPLAVFLDILPEVHSAGRQRSGLYACIHLFCFCDSKVIKRRNQHFV